MDTPITALTQPRALLRELRQLADEPAPADLATTALVQIGLADSVAPFDTAIGPTLIAFNGRGVSALEPGQDVEQFARECRARFGRPIRPLDRAPGELADRLHAWLDGDRRAKPRFDLRGRTEFEADVLGAALKIPRGELRPYTWIAREIGRPGAVRAVGSALGRNPIPLLIPCHRVIRADGDLGQYALGPATKRQALAAEGLDLDQLEQFTRAGVRYTASRNVKVYCHPTCRCGRRIINRNLVTFTSIAEAERAGYRPCRVCRPV